MCATPLAPINGAHSSVDKMMPYGASLTFSCDENFALVGDETIKCRQGTGVQGVFSGKAPLCCKYTYWEKHARTPRFGLITNGPVGRSSSPIITIDLLVQ